MIESGKISREQIQAAKEKYAGIVLSDRQVIDLISGVEAVTLDEAVQWYGVNLPKHQRPIARFSQISKEYFDEFSPTEKLRYLKGASTLIFGGVKKRVPFPIDQDRYKSFEVVILGEVNNPSILRLNIGQLLSRALEFCNGNVNEARTLLNQNVVPDQIRTSNIQARVQALTDFFYQVNQPDVKEITAENPNVAILAFWLDIDIGDFGPYSSGSALFEGIFPTTDISIKTEILKYANQTLFSGKATRTMMRMIPLLLMKGEEPYRIAKKSASATTFVEAYESLKASLALMNLFEQLKSRKRVETGILVEMLEEHPTILDYVSLTELDAALDVTKDHGIALRLKNLIEAKKTSPSEAEGWGHRDSNGTP